MGRPKKPTKPPVTPRRDDQYTIPEIPSDVQQIIGRTVILWSSLEAALQDTIWHFMGITIEDGRHLTSRLDTGSLISMTRALARTRIAKKSIDDLYSLLDVIEIFREARNLMMHGTWAILMPENIPVVMSLKPKSEPNEVMSETFSRERLDEINSGIENCTKELVRLMKLLAAANKVTT